MSIAVFASRSALAALTAAQAAAYGKMGVLSEDMAEAWYWDANSVAAAADGEVIVPSDAPAQGRILACTTDQQAVIVLLNAISQAPAASITLLDGRILIGGSDGAAHAHIVSGDGTLDDAGNLLVTKTDGVAFGSFATGTDAKNLTGTAPSGVIPDLSADYDVAGSAAAAQSAAENFATGADATNLAAAKSYADSKIGSGDISGPSSSTAGHLATFADATGKVLADTALSAALDAAIGATQGSVLYRGASMWAALAPGTSGQVLTTQGAGANPKWADQSGGSGGSIPTAISSEPFWPPSSPSAYDDEFTGTLLDSKWSWVHQNVNGTDTASVANSSLTLQRVSTASGDNMAMLLQNAPSTPYTIFAAIATLFSPWSNWAYGHIVLYNSSTGKIIGVGQDNNHEYYRAYLNSPTNFNSENDYTAYHTGPGGEYSRWCFFKIQNNGTNLTISTSNTMGALWTVRETIALSAFIGSIDKIGLGVGTNGASYTSTLVCDFFRVQGT
jgi:hypothetical protein